MKLTPSKSSGWKMIEARVYKFCSVSEERLDTPTWIGWLSFPIRGMPRTLGVMKSRKDEVWCSHDASSGYGKAARTFALT